MRVLVKVALVSAASLVPAVALAWGFHGCRRPPAVEAPAWHVTLTDGTVVRVVAKRGGTLVVVRPDGSKDVVDVREVARPPAEVTP